ncbi:MAG: DUF3048 domain-containing protein [Candidatus Limnocylindrales bacterium]
MRAVACALLVGLLAGACGTTPPSQPANASLPATSGPTAAPSAESLPPTASPSPSVEPTPTPEPTPILVAAPLTGLPVTPAQARRHPIAVMVDDLSAARPQSGFSSASVVWQAPAEGGIPRYMMVFGETRPTDVGPVRSARYYYIAWAAEWKAVYAHAGGSPQALDTLRAKGNGQLVYNADEFRWAGTFRRISSRFSPHNLYTTGKQLDSLAKRLGAKAGNYKPAWQFAPDAPLETRPVGGKISFAYSTSAIRYDYDRKTNSYLRTVSVEGKQKDAATKKRVAPKNVVVMLMSFGPLNDGHPNKHRLEAKVVGSGVAWIATNGRTIKGTWRKKSLTAPTKFYNAAGVAVTLTAGQTFVNVMPTGTLVKITKGAPPPTPTVSPPPGAAPSPSPSGDRPALRLAV